LVADAATSGTLIPLDGLTGSFPNGDAFFLAYAEAVSAVDYMIRTYGSDALVKLIRSYADGRTDDEAFSAALGVDMTAFGAAWSSELKAKAPTKYGPQPDPPGPVPSAWTGVAGGGPVASSTAGTGVAASNAPAASATVVGATGGDDGTGVSALLIGFVALVVFVGVALVVANGRRRRGPSGDAT
jgi:Peptidase MA superfamily